MNASSLADEIGVGRVTLWRWVKMGLVPAPFKNGRESIFDAVAVRMARSVAEAAR